MAKINDAAVHIILLFVPSFYLHLVYMPEQKTNSYHQRG